MAGLSRRHAGRSAVDDAPSHHISAEETIRTAKDYEFLVLYTSTPGFPGDIGLAQAIKSANPNIKIAFVGPHVTVLPDRTLKDCPAIDFICRKEFDYSVYEFANGKPLKESLGFPTGRMERSSTILTGRRFRTSMPCPT